MWPETLIAVVEELVKVRRETRCALANAPYACILEAPLG